MSTNDLNKLAILVILLTIVTEFIVLFIEISKQQKIQEKNNHPVQWCKETDTKIEQLEHEIFLLKLEIKKMG